MNRRMNGLTAVLVAMAFAVSSSAVAAPGTGTDGKNHGSTQAKVGKPAPEFTLKNVDGKEFSLSQFKGKIVVLEWTNHECPVVNRCHGANVMSKTMNKFKGKPVEWVAIDSSSFCAEKIESIKNWTAKQKITYPYLLDAAGKVGHFFGAKTTPHMFVIDKNGVLAYSGAIDNNPYGKEENVTNYVEQTINSLLNGSTVVTKTTKPYGCSVKYKK
jgi:peroxiredoxin